MLVRPVSYVLTHPTEKSLGECEECSLRNRTGFDDEKTTHAMIPSGRRSRSAFSFALPYVTATAKQAFVFATFELPERVAL